MLMLPILIPIKCTASESGLNAYWPGFRSYLSGVVPSTPGFYLRSDVVVYSGTAPKVVLNGFPVDNVKADALVAIVEPEYVFPWKLAGANHAFVVTQALDWAKLSGHVIGTSINASGRRASPGDTIVSPLFLGWQKGNLHYNPNIAIFIPTGDY
jgi:hypothetical protein